MAALICSASGTLPSYIKPCKKNDPNINACVTKAIDQLRDRLAAGIPELEAPAIEPLNLKEIRLLRGPIGARLDVNLTDLKVSGPSTFKVHNLKVDVENLRFTFKVSFERLVFQGKYQIDARILLLRLAGAGDLSGTFDDYDSDVVLQARKLLRDGDTYLTFERMKIKINIGKADLHLSNLFREDSILSTASNELLNQNNALLLDEIRPVLETSLAELFTDVANKVTKSFTLKELFPED
nr:protein takeout-like isoform X2 [Megalopta genalis]